MSSSKFNLTPGGFCLYLFRYIIRSLLLILTRITEEDTLENSDWIVTKSALMRSSSSKSKWFKDFESLNNLLKILEIVCTWLLADKSILWCSDQYWWIMQMLFRLLMFSICESERSWTATLIFWLRKCSLNAPLNKEAIEFPGNYNKYL